MSKISISAACPTDSIEAIKLIHQITGLSLKSTRERLAEGLTGIFYTTELFLNDHLSKDAEIRKLLDGLEKFGVDPFIMELLPDEKWQNVQDFNKYRINVATLLNILNEAKGRYF